MSACLEIKKFPGNVYPGLKTEMPAYMGSSIQVGFYVLFYLGGKVKLETIKKKLDGIRTDISDKQPEKTIEIICIDCTPKESASKKVAV